MDISFIDNFSNLFQYSVLIIILISFIIKILYYLNFFEKYKKGTTSNQKELVDNKIKDKLNSKEYNASLKNFIKELIDDKIKEHTHDTSDKVLTKLEKNIKQCDDLNIELIKLKGELNSILKEYEYIKSSINDNKNDIKETRKELNQIKQTIINNRKIYGNLE